MLFNMYFVKEYIACYSLVELFISFFFSFYIWILHFDGFFGCCNITFILYRVESIIIERVVFVLRVTWWRKSKKKYSNGNGYAIRINCRNLLTSFFDKKTKSCFYYFPCMKFTFSIFLFVFIRFESSKL